MYMAIFTPIGMMILDGFRPIFGTIHAFGTENFPHEIHLTLLGTAI